MWSNKSRKIVELLIHCQSRHRFQICSRQRIGPANQREGRSKWIRSKKWKWKRQLNQTRRSFKWETFRAARKVNQTRQCNDTGKLFEKFVFILCRKQSKCSVDLHAAFQAGWKSCWRIGNLWKIASRQISSVFCEKEFWETSTSMAGKLSIFFLDNTTSRIWMTS